MRFFSIDAKVSIDAGFDGKFKVIYTWRVNGLLHRVRVERSS